MTISAAITAAGGCFYAQYFLFIDAGIAYGPWISVEALLAPIIGGIGTVFGPLLGALVVKTLGEVDQARDRRCAGPRSRHLRRRADPGRGVRAARHRRPVRRPARAVPSRSRAERRAWLSPAARRERLASASAACSPSTARRSSRDAGPHHRADRPERRRQDHAVRDHHRLPARRAQGRIFYDGDDITGEPPHRLARRGIARTFQIVQPFAGLTVRENIAVGAHLSRPARADALAAAGDVAQRGRPRRCSTGRPRA